MRRTDERQNRNIHIKANVTKIAANEMSLEDAVIDEITDGLTEYTGNTFGTECWLDDVTEGEE